MEKYVNTKTGVEIETACKIAGGDWQPVKEKKEQLEKAKKPAKKAKE